VSELPDSTSMHILWVRYSECRRDGQFKVAQLRLGSDMLSPTYHIRASLNPTYKA